jgi:hypothetical protein
MNRYQSPAVHRSLNRDALGRKFIADRFAVAAIFEAVFDGGAATDMARIMGIAKLAAQFSMGHRHSTVLLEIMEENGPFKICPQNATSIDRIEPKSRRWAK